MKEVVIIAIICLVLFAIIFFKLVTKTRRLNELKVKTLFASKSDELVKIEINGNDSVSEIANNFNLLGSRLSFYRNKNHELSEIKSEKENFLTKLKEFENSLSQLNLLTEIGREITSCLNINEIVLKLFKFINSSMIAEEMCVLILKNGRKRYFRVFNGELEEIKKQKWTDDRDNLLNWAYENKREAYLNEASKDFGQFVFNPIVMVDGITAESVIAIPLGVSNKMIGAVTVLCSTKNTFNDFHLDFARSMASYVSVAIDNANLYEELDQEKQKSDELLLNILPFEVASELKKTGRSEAKQYENVTVIFTDFVNFTGISESLSPKRLVEEIDLYFQAFDTIIESHKLEKIKTIGDAYLAVCGLPNSDENHAVNIVKSAIEINEFVKNQRRKGGLFDIRLGIHSGPVVAGIVGVKKFAYDIWGDTVNLASRMESNSEPGKINISGATYELVKDYFNCQYRGKIEVKNKGMIDMYFVLEGKEA